MAPVPVVLQLPTRREPEPPEAGDGEVVFVDMEEFSADNKCSCAASDDNPY